MLTWRALYFYMYIFLHAGKKTTTVKFVHAGVLNVIR